MLLNESTESLPETMEKITPKGVNLPELNSKVTPEYAKFISKHPAAQFIVDTRNATLYAINSDGRRQIIPEKLFSQDAKILSDWAHEEWIKKHGGYFVQWADTLSDED